ncbi:DUF2235 domain-containing protein [Novosphingobium mangrovi (ex Hu et al. 2023)]|uniref:DUF2235 domain-containing protein n=1 Tax=Novosphingobium mangrovi (ex Hu et al. 2023) TaxID=2930094 RepID=A0ABT0AAI7_9SPHN|nr:DUF2235 domain-containing protein [Novosphingobium mangrovi (ex Hu et al. 2023)]MCJ1960215.1 DUF2235 domain-containing protein [Novosphingobium mangrovi (ex Hu et al. 2023)]
MSKSLIVCCDGTWNSADQKGEPTNVTKMARAILPRTATGRAQVIYYDEGVGSGNVLDRVVGGAFGTGLGTNVQQAYRFLCQNYDVGDSLFLFGFSRGAYTVRSLAGLVGLVGLVRKGDLDKLPEIWAYYRKDDRNRAKAPLDMALFEGRHPDIEMVGVWDTVGALGVPTNFLGPLGRRRHAFHDVKLGGKVRHAYHALAIDERRRKFVPAIWDTKGGIPPGQEVEQVWFAGAHSNVGGGYPDKVLSDIALLWMCDKAKPFLELDEDYLARKVERVEQGAARGLLVDSARHAFWKLQGQKERALGSDATETIHPSVLARLNLSRDSKASLKPPFAPFPYLPRNLLRFLEKTGLIR